METYCNRLTRKLFSRPQHVFQKKSQSAFSRCPEWLFAHLALIVFFLGFSIAPVNCIAKNISSDGQKVSAEDLTHSLIVLNDKYQNIGVDKKDKILNKLLKVASKRQKLLSKLMEDNAGEVLRIAVHSDIRASFPPEVQSYIEEETAAEGELEVAYEDNNEESRLRYFLDTTQKRFSLHFKEHPPMLQTGTHVRATGMHIDQAMALESGDSSIELLPLSNNISSVTQSAQNVLPNTFGEQRTVVILVNFQDLPSEPWTPEQARDLVFNRVSDFYLENSYAQTWLGGDVYGWYTIPVSSSPCDTTSIESEAKNAATSAGADLSQYTRFVYMFPTTNACTFAGLAWVGGSPSKAFINGTLSPRVFGHELGHNLGLFHAHGLDCDTSPLGDNCSSLDTGDRADIMGGREGHFNAFNKERLGWLNNGATPPITTVESSGSYTLDSYETNSLNTKALKILKGIDSTSSGAKTWYYLEYRQLLGFDTILNGVGNLVDGVLIRTGSEASGEGSYQLDMTPNSDPTFGYGDLEDGALEVGRTFFDPAAGVTITATWADNTSASLDVTLNQSCRAKPSVSISPAQSLAVTAGTPVTYTVTVNNTDSTECGVSTFDLQEKVPSGWTFAFANSQITVNAGGVASTALSVTSQTSAPAGSYAIQSTVTNSTDTSYTGSVTATYSIGSFSIVVSTDNTTYAKGRTVTITGSAKTGGVPVAGAGVNFTITKPNGSVVKQSSTTDAQGQAVYKLRLNKQKDPAGVYSVKATANIGSQTASGTTSFSVQ